MAFSAKQQAFIDSIMPAAIEVSKATGVDPRIIAAQAAHESAFGTRAPGNNFFGVKAIPGEPFQNLRTTEMVNGKLVPTRANFAKYDTPAAGLAGYTRVMNLPYYAGVRNAQGLDAQLTALGKSPYATDKGYAGYVGNYARQIPVPPNNIPNVAPAYLSGPLALGPNGFASRGPAAPLPPQAGATPGYLGGPLAMGPRASPASGYVFAPPTQFADYTPSRDVQPGAGKMLAGRSDLFGEWEPPQQGSIADVDLLPPGSPNFGAGQGSVAYSDLLPPGRPNFGGGSGEGSIAFDDLLPPGSPNFGAPREAGSMVAGRGDLFGSWEPPQQGSIAYNDLLPPGSPNFDAGRVVSDIPPGWEVAEAPYRPPPGAPPWLMRDPRGIQGPESRAAMGHPSLQQPPYDGSSTPYLYPNDQGSGGRPPLGDASTLAAAGTTPFTMRRSGEDLQRFGGSTDWVDVSAYAPWELERMGMSPTAGQPPLPDYKQEPFFGTPASAQPPPIIPTDISRYTSSLSGADYGQPVGLSYADDPYVTERSQQSGARTASSTLNPWEPNPNPYPNLRPDEAVPPPMSLPPPPPSSPTVQVAQDEPQESYGSFDRGPDTPGQYWYPTPDYTRYTSGLSGADYQAPPPPPQVAASSPVQARPVSTGNTAATNSLYGYGSPAASSSFIRGPTVQPQTNFGADAYLWGRGAPPAAPPLVAGMPAAGGALGYQQVEPSPIIPSPIQAPPPIDLNQMLANGQTQDVADYYASQHPDDPSFIRPVDAQGNFVPDNNEWRDETQFLPDLGWSDDRYYVPQ